MAGKSNIRQKHFHMVHWGSGIVFLQCFLFIYYIDSA